MILKERYTKTPVLGTVSWNTYSDLRGDMVRLLVNPSSSTTSFDFSITDDEGEIIYEKKGAYGVLRDDSRIGVFGIHTLKIENASTSSNAFTITLLWKEGVTP